jgi:hypothetical protein
MKGFVCGGIMGAEGARDYTGTCLLFVCFNVKHVVQQLESLAVLLLCKLQLPFLEHLQHKPVVTLLEDLEECEDVPQHRGGSEEAKRSQAAEELCIV